MQWRNSFFVLVLIRISLASILVISANAIADQRASFFGSETAIQRSRAAFDESQKQWLLQGAHDCNRAGKASDEQRQCNEREREVRESIATRTRQLHQQVEPQRSELRALHRQQRGW